MTYNDLVAKSLDELDSMHAVAFARFVNPDSVCSDAIRGDLERLVLATEIERRIRGEMEAAGLPMHSIKR